MALISCSIVAPLNAIMQNSVSSYVIQPQSLKQMKRPSLSPLGISISCIVSSGLVAAAIDRYHPLPPATKPSLGLVFIDISPSQFPVYLAYVCVQEVRKTLIVGHVRLGEVPIKGKKALGDGETEEETGQSAAVASGEEGGKEEEQEMGAVAGEEEKEEELSPTAIEMTKWYTGLTVYEVAVTPWRSGTPLARLSRAAKNQNAQLKRGGGRKAGKRQSR